ncbi:MAG: HAMP domain-containing protein [Candidatus Dadabacteria bacterium]|nr:MAG: HAMP domain-containing protein [Candidatus Dadabacteria bacterium]
MKKLRTLTWKFFVPNLLVFFLSFITLSIYAHFIYKKTVLDHSFEHLESYARLVSFSVGDYATKRNLKKLARRLAKISSDSGVRITIISPAGVVLADTAIEPGKPVNLIDRPEVKSALSGKNGHATHISFLLGDEMIYSAVPVKANNRILYVVRASVPLTFLNEIMREAAIPIIISVILIGLAVLLISYYLATLVTRSLDAIRRAAKKFAAGNLDFKVPPGNTYETALLARVLNRMAQRLDERIRTANDQRNQLDAVLDSMVEGVIAVDKADAILIINKAALEFLGLEDNPAVLNFYEAVRSTEFRQLYEKILKTEQSAEKVITLHTTREYVIQLHASPLRDADDRAIGVLFVFNDITHLRRLEKIRSDFVANVSHELKTPITSIKGFVETLLAGALNSPEDSRRFIEIIKNHTDRLNDIIDDLLSLSRIEQDQSARRIELKETSIREIVDSAISLCSRQAASRGIELINLVPAHARASVNSSLIQQALLNLIDNAIKYSGRAGKVEIVWEEHEGENLLSVKDYGRGIERIHQSRIFERFYRVDRGRSRQEGGTGLGLAIVKHIAAVHGGVARVKSTPGQGSTFSIILPARMQDAA